MSSVLTHLIEAISPASLAQAAAARDRLGAPTPAGSATLAELACRLAAARHAPRPRVARKAIAVCFGDHGVGDPGIDLGAHHPTAVVAHALAGADAALTAVARGTGAKILLLDCGTVAAAHLPASVVQIGRWPGGDATAGAAMTHVECALALEAGIAVATALGDDGLDVLALGQVGVGAEVTSATLVAALTGASVDEIAAAGDRDAVAAALAASTPRGSALETLAALGGPDTAVMVGLILAAASMDVPIVLDDHATSAAALVAVRLAPAVAGYLIAAHGGTHPAHRRALAALGLAPLFELGLARGEGTGAALALPLLDGAASLLGAA